MLFNLCFQSTIIIPNGNVFYIEMLARSVFVPKSVSTQCFLLLELNLFI